MGKIIGTGFNAPPCVVSNADISDNPDWVAISQVHKRIAIIDLCRPSDVHRESNCMQPPSVNRRGIALSSMHWTTTSARAG
jgi:hypothetical protein